MSANMQSMPAGGNIWNMVKSANPNATNTEIATMTNAVLKDNNMTPEQARTIQAGQRIDMSAAKGGNTPTAAAAPKPAPVPAPAPPPAAPSPRQPAALLAAPVPPAGVQQQPAVQRPTGSLAALAQTMFPSPGEAVGLPGSLPALTQPEDINSVIQLALQGFGQGQQPTSGLDSFLFNLGGLSPQAALRPGSTDDLAARSGNFAFGISGQGFLPFANPNVVLGNLGLLG